MSVRGKLIQDVAEYVSAGGEYYTCDPSVCAEACLPLTDGVGTGNLIGIIDAETKTKNFFTSPTLAHLLAFTLGAQELLQKYG